MNHYDHIGDSALSRLRHEEICVVVLKDGSQREAAWHVHNKLFYFASPPAGTVTPDEVIEWWPAGVKF